MLNQREKFVKNILEKQGHKVKRIQNIGYPDFLIDDSFYVEVKNADFLRDGMSSLSTSQNINFKKIKLPIKIFYVIEKRKIVMEDFVPMENFKHIKNYVLVIQDKDEKEWDYFVKNKEERNIDEAILNLIKEKVKKLKEVRK